MLRRRTWVGRCRQSIDDAQLEARLYRQRFIKTFLSNLLPESPAVLEAWEKKYHVSRNNPFGLLKHVGEDCPGALQFVQPERLAEYQHPGPAQIQWITLGELRERLALLREDAAAFRLVTDQGRMSLAGVQSKTALYFDGRRWGGPPGACRPVTY